MGRFILAIAAAMLLLGSIAVAAEIPEGAKFFPQPQPKPLKSSSDWVPPNERPGHIYLPAPTQDQMDVMLRERVEKHACMHKSRSEDMRLETLNPLLSSYPTGNMSNYDVMYYKIDIAVDMGVETVDGYVDIYASSLINGLDYVDLTLTDALSVTQVRLDGVAETFSHGGDILTVFFSQSFNIGEDFTVRVYYNGVPNYSNLDGMDFYTYAGNKVCYTNCEPFGARNWWPCKDFTFDKCDSADIIITHPTTYGGDPMDCVSNGKLVSVTSLGGGLTKTHWHSSYPITTYLIALGITDYNKNTQQWEYSPGQFMPVEHNYYPSVGPGSGSTFYMIQYTLPALDALSSFWGIYPFVNEKYGHMHYGWGGAMEHQTCTSISPSFSTEYVIPHELAHQWAGDAVTCTPFNNIWLNEGFASYGEVLHFEYNYGWPTAKSWLNSQRHIDAGSPYVENIETEDIFDGTTVYDKGSWLVHMLRNQMGDSIFFPAMEYYFHDSEFAGGAATTQDLSDLCSQYYGDDMDWFFDAWVYQDNQPNYVYSYIWEEEAKSGDFRVDFFLEQNNNGDVFPMWVEIKAYAGTFDTLYRVWNGAVGDPYVFYLPAAPDSFKIDPSEKILRTIVQAPWDMHILTGAIPDAIVNEPFTFTLEAIAGTAPYTWTKILGQIPYPMTLNNSTGEISGTPLFEGSYYFKIRCTDSSVPAKVDERAYIMQIVGPPGIPGDADGSGGVDIDDVVYLIDYIFSGGPAPTPLETGDANCSGGIDIDDVVYLIAYIFSGGPAPCFP